MERTKKQRHQAVTPAPKAFPSWKTPQPSPGSDNTASASSQSRGRDPSLLFLPFSTGSAMSSGPASAGDGGAHGWQGMDFPGGNAILGQPFPALQGADGCCMSHPQPQLRVQSRALSRCSWWQEEHTQLGTLSLSLPRRARLVPSWPFCSQQELGLGQVRGKSCGCADWSCFQRSASAFSSTTRGGQAPPAAPSVPGNRPLRLHQPQLGVFSHLSPLGTAMGMDTALLIPVQMG